MVISAKKEEKEMAESAEGEDCFPVGWPRSIFWENVAVEQRPEWSENRATEGAFQPEGANQAKARDRAAWGVQGAAEECGRLGIVTGGSRGGLWAEDMISLLLGEETSGGIGINRNTSQEFLPWSGETIGPEEGSHGGGMKTCWWNLLEFVHLLKVEPVGFVVVVSTRLER